MKDKTGQYLGTIIIIAILVSVTVLGTVSESQSRFSILALYSMSISAVIVLFAVVFSAPTEGLKKGLGENTALIIAVSVISQVIATLIAAIIIHYFGL